MREIKFRLFDIKDKKMYGNIEKGNGIANIFINQYGVLSGIKVFQYQECGNFYFKDFEIENENFKLMQFTGLKDKNGVEIYEGDIVERISIDPQWEKNKKGCVIFDKGYFITQEFALHYINISRYEVIGNIYENKDLL